MTDEPTTLESVLRNTRKQGEKAGNEFDIIIFT